MVRHIAGRPPLRRRFGGCPANASAFFSSPVPLKAASQAKCCCPWRSIPASILRRTTYLTRMIQRWGKLPLLFLESLNIKEQRYALIGTEDWFMYPSATAGNLCFHRRDATEDRELRLEQRVRTPDLLLRASPGFCLRMGQPERGAVDPDTPSRVGVQSAGLQISHRHRFDRPGFWDRYASGSGAATPYAALSSSRSAVKSAI